MNIKRARYLVNEYTGLHLYYDKCYKCWKVSWCEKLPEDEGKIQTSFISVFVSLNTLYEDINEILKRRKVILPADKRYRLDFEPEFIF